MVDVGGKGQLHEQHSAGVTGWSTQGEEGSHLDLVWLWDLGTEEH